MKFKGSFLTSASGSLGGITASHNRGGLYLRSRLVPTDPASALQMPARQRLGAVTARWLADLSESQRDEWNTYADNTTVLDTLGDPIHLSGHQQFVRTNVAALGAGLAQIDDAPSVFGTGELPETGTLSIAVSTVSQVIANFPANTTGLLFAGRPQNASVTYFNGPWRFVTTGVATPLAGTNPFPAAAGQRQWVAVRYLNDDGRLSGRVQAGPVIITADP